MNLLKYFIIFNLLFPLHICIAGPKGTGMQLPRSACIKSSKVNLHVGPGTKHPVEWVITCKNLPVLITAEYDQWRRIKCPDGSVGWVHKSLLSNKKVMITKEQTNLYAKKSESSQKIAKLDSGVIVFIKKKTPNLWSYVEFSNNDVLFKGWVKTSAFWEQ